MKKSLVLIVLIVLALSIPAYSYRPLTTDDTATVSKDKWSLETGLESDTDRASNTTNSLNIDLTYGYSENMDLKVSSSIQSAAGSSGVGSTAFQAKYRFTEEDGNMPSLGLEGSIAFPAYTGGNSTISTTGLYTKTLDTYVYHLNLGLSGNGDYTSVNYGGAFDVVFHPEAGINITMELVGGSTNSGATLAGHLGTKWTVNEDLTVDGGMSVGLNDNTSSDIKAGLTTTF
ncbi:hypothetical protein ACFLZ2_00630 [Candidatus Margulisiibacteriota bacterium]